MNTGLDIDIVTGKPLKREISEFEIKANQRKQKTISRYENLISDISGNGGEVLKQIAELFVNRINQIIKEDPECKAYQNIFDTMQIKINMGRKIVTSKYQDLEDKCKE